MRCALTRHLVLKILLVLLAVSSTSCSLRSTTDIIKSPFLPSVQETFKAEQMSHCLNMEYLETILVDEDNDSFSSLRIIASDFDNKSKKAGKLTLLEETKSVLKAEKLNCSDIRPQWEFLKEIITKNHEGLFLFNGTGNDSRDALKKAVGPAERISISYNDPASLSMSARPLPAEQETGNAFSSLSARAQASLINYAQAFKDSKSTISPEMAVEGLLDRIGQTTQIKYADTRRVELTVSSVLNSAAADDRFDYIAAYLSLPPMPYTVNGSVSLEKEFLLRLQAIMTARASEERSDHIKADIRRALDRIRVRIEIVDSLKTEAATLQLGKITSTAGLNIGPFGEYGTAVQSGDTIRTLNLSKGVGSSLSATREDTIAKELDKRSFWIDPDRTLLRITQRGMQEATISGSMSSALTIKVPKTSLYVISINENEAPPEESGNGNKKSIPVNTDKDAKKYYTFKLHDIEQPLYASIDAVGVVLGTVRIAQQPTLLFKKEADGVAYSVAEGPFRLNLWKNERALWSLDLHDLLPGFEFSKNKKASLGRFVIYSKQPFVDQAARFDGKDEVLKFVKLIHKENKFRLVKHAPLPDKKHYYVMLSCAKKSDEVEKARTQKEPGLDEFWLGMHIDGKLIDESSWAELKDEIGDCGKQNVK